MTTVAWRRRGAGRRWGWLAMVLAAVAMLSACGGEEPSLLLRLQTDLVAQADYSEARIVVSGASAGIEDEITSLTREVTRDEGREVRLGEVGPLSGGDYRIDVELWTEFGSRVAANRLLVQVRGPTVVTIPITADCAGLTCPGRGDAPEATFCLGGTCVPEVCRQDRAAAGCPAAECAADGECESAVACAEPRCDEGVCVAEPNDDLCEASEICSARLGCLPVGDEGGCTPGSCDDFNPCTDDVCGDEDCVFTANTGPCGDGVFCNGADTCAAGLCASHDGDPCDGIGACDEATRTCLGASVCGADARVVSGECVPCPAGTQNDPGDDPAGSDTECAALLCALNQRVLENACFPCPAGTANAAGDDASGPNTTCIADACPANQRVSMNSCAPCPVGEFNAGGDDPAGPDTFCSPTACPADHRVVSNRCVRCLEGETRAAGDLTNGPDTSCDCADALRSDAAAPYVEWYARGNAYNAGGMLTLERTDFYRRTLPVRASEVVGGTTRLVIQDFLNQVYLREFSRPIEPDGLEFWTARYESGANFAGLQSSIVAGAGSELTTRVEQSCGTPIESLCVPDVRSDSDAPYATCTLGRLYARDATGRGTAEPEPVEYYTGTASPSERARDTTYGDLNDLINEVYRTNFGRPPDCAGLAFWADTYVRNTGWTLDRLRAELLAAGSDELVSCDTDATKSCIDYALNTCGGTL